MQKNILILIMFLSLAIFHTAIAQTATDTAKPTETKPAATKVESKPNVVYEDVSALAVAQNPQKYLNKNIRIKGIFDKFSVVGLDYKPAFRSSEDYILFLIRKAEVKGHVIPLAEMKLFITRKEAEKHIDLESGDEIQFTGKVFATALSDPWIDVDSITIVTKSKKHLEKDKEREKLEKEKAEKEKAEKEKAGSTSTDKPKTDESGATDKK